MIRNSSGIQFSIEMWFHPWQQHYINFLKRFLKWLELGKKKMSICF